MKRGILTLGLLLELCFLSFYAVKYLSLKWGVEKLFFDDSKIFGLTFGVLAIALVIQIISGIFASRNIIPYKHILVFSIIFNLSLLFVWNIGSDDLYTHIQRGRMVAKYGASPYTTTYDSFSYDKFYKETKTVWSSQLSIYGPVFTNFGAVVSYIAGDSLLAHVLIYKLIYSALNILTGWLIYKITKSPLASLLFSWSPLVIFEIQANNHFEILSIFPIVLSIYLLVSGINWKRYILALSILTLGSLTKYFGLIIYPFFIIYAIKKLSTVKEKFLFVTIGGAVQLIIVGLAFLPFIGDIFILNGLFELAGGTFTSPSITILFASSALELFNFKKEIAQNAVQLGYKVYYVLLSVKSIFLRFSDKKDFLKTLVLVFAGFTLVYLNLVLPWYTLTLLALISIYYGLTKEKRYIIFSYMLTIYSLLLYIRVK